MYYLEKNRRHILWLGGILGFVVAWFLMFPLVCGVYGITKPFIFLSLGHYFIFTIFSGCLGLVVSFCALAERRLTHTESFLKLTLVWPVVAILAFVTYSMLVHAFFAKFFRDDYFGPNLEVVVQVSFFAIPLLTSLTVLAVLWVTRAFKQRR